ncbi:MAG TPA: entericidin A/B family lipoprotein [Geminicoccaceae bacterium]|nr:entericidin A/B family lipoprotein [Geminicoccaceae bacterium]
MARFFPIAAMLLVAAALLLSACNTMRGLGEDVSTAGDTLSETSEDVKN